MKLSRMLNRFVGNQNSSAAAKKNRRKTRLMVEGLEQREVFALNISLNPVSGLLAISGSNSNDVCVVGYARNLDATVGLSTIDKSKVTVVLQTDFGYSTTQTFSTSQVKSVSFCGQDGNDFFQNTTYLPSTTSSWDKGTVSTSLANGSSNNATNSTSNLGTFTVSASGQVTIDYLYDGAGYRGQMGIYSLTGMDKYTPGSAAYNKEAARRILSDSTLGHIAISVQNETAKFEGNMPWEGDMHNGHGAYLGPKTFAMTPGDKFGTMLVPNGLIQDVYKTPAASGALTPLYSVPYANPYIATSQLLGQVGDLDGHGSVFAYEDLRLDEGSDKDYNDLIFQVTGARGNSTPVSEVINSDRDFQTSSVGQQLLSYAGKQESTDLSSSVISPTGVETVGVTGQVGIDFLYDGGGFHGEMAIFSLQGMGNLTPGSSAFIQEAARRALTDSTLGHVVISDTSEAARTSAALPWESDYNDGAYQGIKTFSMSPGDTFATMLVPNGFVWQVYSNPSVGGSLRPLFSLPSANPTSQYGSDQLADITGQGTTFGFEDIRLDSGSDRDFNDIVYRLTGASGSAPALTSVVACADRDFRLTSKYATIIA